MILKFFKWLFFVLLVLSIISAVWMYNDGLKVSWSSLGLPLIIWGLLRNWDGKRTIKKKTARMNQQKNI